MGGRFFHNEAQALIQGDRFYVPRVGIDPNDFGPMGKRFPYGMLQAGGTDPLAPGKGSSPIARVFSTHSLTLSL